MCTTCGCGESDVEIDQAKQSVAHHHDEDNDGGGLLHVHKHEDQHDHPNILAYGSGARRVQIEADILSRNNQYAVANRRELKRNGVFTLNLVSSPGSGKTSLLVESINKIAGKYPVSVIEGDQQTTNDADKIRSTGAKAVQINTGKGCHLDAHMVGHALPRLPLADGGLLFIENVGNLVCPAAFDLGEIHKVVILSVTEGEDKPIKYPHMFAASDLMLLNKCDLLPYLDFDVELCISHARRVNPALKIMQVSARTKDGLDDWVEWLGFGAQMAKANRP